jgi:hypothetical protein
MTSTKDPVSIWTLILMHMGSRPEDVPAGAVLILGGMITRKFPPVV